MKFIKLEIKCSPLNEHLLLYACKILLMGFLLLLSCLNECTLKAKIHIAELL